MHTSSSKLKSPGTSTIDNSTDCRLLTCHVLIALYKLLTDSSYVVMEAWHTRWSHNLLVMIARVWLVDGRAQGLVALGLATLLLSIYMLHLCTTIQEVDFDCEALRVHN